MVDFIYKEYDALFSHFEESSEEITGTVTQVIKFKKSCEPQAHELVIGENPEVIAGYKYSYLKVNAEGSFPKAHKAVIDDCTLYSLVMPGTTQVKAMAVEPKASVLEQASPVAPIAEGCGSMGASSVAVVLAILVLLFWKRKMNDKINIIFTDKNGNSSIMLEKELIPENTVIITHDEIAGITLILLGAK